VALLMPVDAAFVEGYNSKIAAMRAGVSGLRRRGGAVWGRLSHF
jgi:hypothetical protein